MNKRALLAGAIAAVVSTTVSAQVYDSDDAGADEPGHEPGEYLQSNIWDKPGFYATGHEAITGSYFAMSLDRLQAASLINVTTPKRGQPGFEESKEFLNSLIAGKSLRIVVPVGTPRTESGSVLVHAWRIESDGSRTNLNKLVREHTRSQPTLTAEPGDITHRYQHLVERVCKSLGLEAPDVTILDYWNSLDAQEMRHPGDIPENAHGVFTFGEARSSSSEHNPRKYILLFSDIAKNPQTVVLWHELAHAMLSPKVKCLRRLEETSDLGGYNTCVHDPEFWHLEKKLWEAAKVLQGLPKDKWVSKSCEDAERVRVPRYVGTKGGGAGFPISLVSGPRDGDGDGVVCEE